MSDSDSGSDELYKNFCAATLACDVVLCCRVSPKQKSDIVQMVRSAQKSKVTLAIGDGANDVNMITKAHIGIGIRGVEGQAAARASDFIIGEFRFLKRLLFVYGKENYRRNANMVIYNFYKNILVCITQWWWGYENMWSGQTLYEAMHYQLYNALYTAFPIMIYALWDKQAAEETFLTYPKLYVVGPKKLYFNNFRFGTMVVIAIFEGLIIQGMCLCMIDDNWVLINGGSLGFNVFGQTVFVGVCFMVNLKIVTMSHTFFPINTIIISLSLLSLGFTWWFCSECMELLGLQNMLENTFWITISTLNFWFVIIFIIALSIGDYAILRFMAHSMAKFYAPMDLKEEYNINSYNFRTTLFSHEMNGMTEELELKNDKAVNNGEENFRGGKILNSFVSPKEHLEVSNEKYPRISMI